MSDNATKPRIWWGIERGQYPDFFNSLVECENYKQNCERSDEVGYRIINVIEKKAYDELTVHFKALCIICDDLIPENSSLQKQLEEFRKALKESTEAGELVLKQLDEARAEIERLKNAEK